MDLLRGPALVVIAMILLLAGVLLITAFAALIAQMSLLFKLRPRNSSKKYPEWMGSLIEKGRISQEPYERVVCTNGTAQTSFSKYQGSPQVVVNEPGINEVVDAVWWQV